MKLHGVSFVAAFAALLLLGGCATLHKKTTAAPNLSIKGPADAIIYISGLT